MCSRNRGIVRACGDLAHERRSTDLPGVLVVVKLIRVLVLVVGVVRLEVACVMVQMAVRSAEFALKCRVVSVRAVVLDVPSLLGCLSLLTAAPHGVTPSFASSRR